MWFYFEPYITQKSKTQMVYSNQFKMLFDIIVVQTQHINTHSAVIKTYNK